MPRKDQAYESVSLPKELLDAVRDLLKQEPGLGYGSMAEFVKEAVRWSLAEVGYAKVPSEGRRMPAFAPRRPLNKDTEDAVLALDRLLRDLGPRSPIVPVIHGVREAIVQVGESERARLSGRHEKATKKP